MANKTRDVKLLVDEVLPSLSKPYTEDVTWEVCRAISANPKWQAKYDSLVAKLTVDVVNNWIGQYVAASLGWQRDRQVKASGPLIKSYSKLKR